MLLTLTSEGHYFWVCYIDQTVCLPLISFVPCIFPPLWQVRLKLHPYSVNEERVCSDLENFLYQSSRSETSLKFVKSLFKHIFFPLLPSRMCRSSWTSFSLSNFIFPQYIFHSPWSILRTKAMVKKPLWIKILVRTTNVLLFTRKYLPAYCPFHPNCQCGNLRLGKFYITNF